MNRSDGHDLRKHKRCEYEGAQQCNHGAFLLRLPPGVRQCFGPTRSALLPTALRDGWFAVPERAHSTNARIMSRNALPRARLAAWKKSGAGQFGLGNVGVAPEF
jgi:hypothetical protein